MSYIMPASPPASRPGTRHASPEELVLYALQFLSGEQAADLTHHFEHCAECLSARSLVEGDLVACAFSVEPHSPPALARQRMRTQVARENRIVAQPTLAAFGRLPCGRTGRCRRHAGHVRLCDVDHRGVAS